MTKHLQSFSFNSTVQHSFRLAVPKFRILDCYIIIIQYVNKNVRIFIQYGSVTAKTVLANMVGPVQ